MLKDVGRDSSAKKSGNKEACIHAAKQGMRACNNNNMRNPLPSYIFYFMGVTNVICIYRDGADTPIKPLINVTAGRRRQRERDGRTLLTSFQPE